MPKLFVTLAWYSGQSRMMHSGKVFCRYHYKSVNQISSPGSGSWALRKAKSWWHYRADLHKVSLPSLLIFVGLELGDFGCSLPDDMDSRLGFQRHSPEGPLLFSRGSSFHKGPPWSQACDFQTIRLTRAVLSLLLMPFHQGQFEIARVSLGRF